MENQNKGCSWVLILFGIGLVVAAIAIWIQLSNGVPRREAILMGLIAGWLVVMLIAVVAFAASLGDALEKGWKRRIEPTLKLNERERELRLRERELAMEARERELKKQEEAAKKEA